MSNFIIEPYNAWNRTPRKKHWMEIVEEEALMAKIIKESQQTQQLIQTQNGNVIGGGNQPEQRYYQPITSDFSANSVTGYAPLTVTFTPVGRNSTNFLWNFGDGTTSTEVSPTHTFSNTQSYNISLTVQGLSQPSSSTTKSNYISASIPTVSASFVGTPTTGSIPLSVTFTNSTLNGSTYLWTFGDGTSSSLENPTKVYSQTGSYTVILRATGSFGLTNSLTRTNYISASL